MACMFHCIFAFTAWSRKGQSTPPQPLAPAITSATDLRAGDNFLHPSHCQAFDTAQQPEIALKQRGRPLEVCATTEMCVCVQEASCSPELQGRGVRIWQHRLAAPAMQAAHAWHTAQTTCISAPPYRGAIVSLYMVISIATMSFCTRRQCESQGSR